MATETGILHRLGKEALRQIVEAAEEPRAARVRHLHLEAAVELDGMSDDLVGEQGVVVRVGHHGHLVIEAGQGRRDLLPRRLLPGGG